MDVTALFSHPSADSIVAYRGGGALRAAQFLDDARLLADSLPRDVMSSTRAQTAIDSRSALRRA